MSESDSTIEYPMEENQGVHNSEEERDRSPSPIPPPSPRRREDRGAKGGLYVEEEGVLVEEGDLNAECEGEWLHREEGHQK